MASRTRGPGRAGARTRGTQAQAPAHGGAGLVRIIGGQWRGRRLPVPVQDGLRPTSDRVREALFNWLAPVMPGARCLDLFAGSGALGLEAASRGAAQVVLVEHSPLVARQLADNLSVLGASGVQVIQADALDWLARRRTDLPHGAFDLVFLDPPFAAGLLAPACALLAGPGWLAPGARVYLESDLDSSFPPLPADWELIRERRAGQVRYGLVLVQPPSEPDPNPAIPGN